MKDLLLEIELEIPTLKFNLMLEFTDYLLSEYIDFYYLFTDDFSMIEWG